MEQIQLTNEEKAVLRQVLLGFSALPRGVCEDAYADCVFTLEEYGLVHAAWDEGRRVVDVRITDKGRSFIHKNPQMTPKPHSDWSKIGAIATIVGVLATVLGIILGMLVACTLMR